MPSSVMWVLTRAIWRHIQEDGILHKERDCELHNLPLYSEMSTKCGLISELRMLLHVGRPLLFAVASLLCFPGL
jgi:hypothetical protein